MSNLIYFVITGIIAGWLAGQFIRGAGFGMAGDLIVGVIGAVLGGFVFRLIGLTASGLIGEIVVATAGAVLLLFGLRYAKRK